MNSWDKAVLPRLFDWIGAVDGPVLDAGCGVGKLGTALAHRGGGNGRPPEARNRSRPNRRTRFEGTLLAEAGPGYAGARRGGRPPPAVQVAVGRRCDRVEFAAPLPRRQPGDARASAGPASRRSARHVRSALHRAAGGGEEDAAQERRRLHEGPQGVPRRRDRDLLGSSGLQVDEVDPSMRWGHGSDRVRLSEGRPSGLAPRNADSLAALDDFICGADGRTPPA